MVGQRQPSSEGDSEVRSEGQEEASQRREKGSPCSRGTTRKRASKEGTSSERVGNNKEAPQWSVGAVGSPG